MKKTILFVSIFVLTFLGLSFTLKINSPKNVEQAKPFCVTINCPNQAQTKLPIYAKNAEEARNLAKKSYPNCPVGGVTSGVCK